MYHGTSKIIRKSKISEDLVKSFLLADFFHNPQFENQSRVFDISHPETDMDHDVMRFLKSESIDLNKRFIEYWFQYKVKDQDLWPHVDYNCGLRSRLERGEDIAPELLMSPITVSCYLETEDLIGGELCISNKPWVYEDNYKTPEQLKQEIDTYSYETYKPQKYDVIYFEGSRNYHWINPVVQGSRKSMLINFWDEIDK